jgi:hypothetical protein
VSSLRYALGVVALCAILVGACGNSGADGADYCDALRDVMSAAPDYGLGRALDAEIAAYLEALERAAAEAPADQEVALRDYADALRSMQADPTADGLGDRLGDALGGMLIVQAHGEQECGLDFGALAETNSSS